MNVPPCWVRRLVEFEVADDVMAERLRWSGMLLTPNDGGPAMQPIERLAVKPKYQTSAIALFMCVMGLSLVAAAQTIEPEIPTGQPLVDLIAELDTKVGTAYITCDVETFVSMVTPDVELYHDDVGKVAGRDAVRDILAQGICDGVKKGIQFRRDLIPGSLVVYRMAKVGALEFRATTFWQRRPGEPETKARTLKR